MDGHRLRLTAKFLLPLIVSLQVPLSSAYPHVNAPYQNTSTSASPDPSQQRPTYYGGHPPALHTADGVSTTWTWSSPSTTDGTQPTPQAVQQIADGQIQELIYTETLSSTSGTDVLYSTSMVTSWVTAADWQSWSSTTLDGYPYTPTPSSDSSTTAQSTSISTTTSSSVSTNDALLSTPNSATDDTTSANKLTLTDTVSSTTSITEEASVTSVPDSSLTSLTTSAVQSATITVAQNTTAAAHTLLETSGNPSSLPFQTSVVNATSTLSLVDTSTISSVGPTATASVTTIQASNIFVAIETNAIPSQITSRGDHPVPTLGIQQQTQRLETNKFYANFFLGDQTAGTWTHPYSVAWSKGKGETDSWGLAVSHIERDQLANGASDPSIDAGEIAFFAAPIGLQSLVLSAAELQAGTTLTTDSLTAFSVNVNLLASGANSPAITFPLVQGMAFVTGEYNGVTPVLQSGIGMTNLTYAGEVVDGTTYKYRASLQDGFNWVIYVTPSSSNYQVNSFTLLTSGEIQGPSAFGGTIQIAKVPGGSQNAESTYDSAAGAYATTADISGSVSGTAGSYTLSWTRAGVDSQSLLMFALPHHTESFSSDTSGGVTDVQLITTTKGTATAVRGNSWSLVEPALPIDMSFAPWSPEHGSVDTVSDAAVAAINVAGYSELSQDVATLTNVGSLYYDGKALAKYAAIIYTVNDIGGNMSLALSGLGKLESAFALHVNNQMQIPLVYDTVWGGAVSSGTYNDGNTGDDFGNTLYNDHHFHYGYFVYAAAVIGYMRPAWLTEGTNMAWVNMLVRDYANSIPNDPDFPFQRMFDWYHGHSWAHGIIETADGKDQESSSEDTMASYGMKMWGQIIGDQNMEARGNLMLAVQQRSLQHYYLYLNNNTVEPSNFIGNKAAGILFENKIDHTTYFGDVPEYIQGIHMLPLMPFSTLTRSQDFVQQEWSAYFAPDGIKPVSEVEGGWQGILMANLAITDPVTSYNYFSGASGNFSIADLDGGASQTWYLAWSAALGGSSSPSSKKRDVSLDGGNIGRSRKVDGQGDERGYIGQRSAGVSKRSSRLRQRTSGRWSA